MMATIAELSKSEFWKTKFSRAVVTRDANKNGSISRGDFEIVFDRYKKIAKSSQQKLDAMRNLKDVGRLSWLSKRIVKACLNLCSNVLMSMMMATLP